MTRRNSAIKKRVKRGISAFSEFNHYTTVKKEKQASCTTARNYIRAENIIPPAVISVMKADGKIDKFFYGSTGLFQYNYAVLNCQEFYQINH
ncbi:MAG: DUF3155 domain-containing protein [Scytonematopsis contorta HA4267-MV1]|jgi:hypothetical protein|nr:DUF3155 domain-containing protein [Scytonematopsis contorta HA4267-MV1]